MATRGNIVVIFGSGIVAGIRQFYEQKSQSGAV
nr:MAG TPA: hypothetical protein [Caudoviricetes sp.]